MTHSYVVYIDESGDEGFVFNDDETGSSRWFVMSAVIVPFQTDKTIPHIMRKLKSDLDLQPKTTIHFAEMKHHKRVPIISAIAASDWTLTNVFINKQQIQQQDVFKGGRFRLYFYATRLLLERVSWFCRDHRPPNSGPARLIFEHRRGLSYEDLGEYFALLRRRANEDAFQRILTNDIRIDWSSIDIENAEPASKNSFAGLQIADCTASGFRAALERTHKFTEHRYAKMMKPVVYKRSSNFRSYGMKFFPCLPTDPERMHWLNKYYP